MTGATGRRHRRVEQPCCKRKLEENCWWCFSSGSAPETQRSEVFWLTDVVHHGTRLLPHPPPHLPPCFSSSSDVRPLPHPRPRHFFLLFFCLGPKIHKQRPSNLFLPKLLSTIWFSEQVTQPAGGKGRNTGGGGEGRGREERRGRRLDKLCSGEILRAFFGKTDDNRSASLQLSLVNAEKTPWRRVGPRMTSTPVALVTCFELMQPFQSLTNWKSLCGDSRVECVNQSHWSLILFSFFF